MGVTTSSPLSNVFKGISANTVFKNGIDLFKDKLDYLSGDSTKLFGFETLLGSVGANPDIALCFSKNEFDILAKWCDSFYSKVDSPNYWSIVRDVAKGQNNTLMDYIKLVWIELDRSEFSSSVIPEPALFIELYKENVDPIFVSREVIPALTGNVNHSSREKVEYCLSIIPNTANLVHLGYFPARSKEKVRITISFRDYSDIALYCETIFAKKLNGDILASIEQLSTRTDYGVLHLDIGSEIVPRIGIEMRFKENELNPEYQWRWKEVLSMIMNKGLCSSEEAERLLDFSGISRFIDEGSLTPTWYKYFLYYIKGVFDFNGKEHYKAYCAFSRQSSK